MLAQTIDRELRERILSVRMMIFDVDGVLTDGRIIYHDDGSEIKVFDVQDGHGLKLLQRGGGVEIALITGRYCKAVEHRAADLGIARVHQNIKRKLDVYERILQETALTDEQIGFVGDDLIDIPVMRRAGWAVAVQNAVDHVKPYAHYITRAGGGHGACREICELLLHVQGRWEIATDRYFKDV